MEPCGRGEVAQGEFSPRLNPACSGAPLLLPLEPSLDCQVVHSPNTDQTTRDSEAGSEILAVVISVVVVALVLLSASLVIFIILEYLAISV